MWRRVSVWMLVAGLLVPPRVGYGETLTGTTTIQETVESDFTTLEEAQEPTTTTQEQQVFMAAENQEPAPADDTGQFGPWLFGNLETMTKNGFEALKYLGLGGGKDPQKILRPGGITYNYTDGTGVFVNDDGTTGIMFKTPGGDSVYILYSKDGTIVFMSLTGGKDIQLRLIYDKRPNG